MSPSFNPTLTGFYACLRTLVCLFLLSCLTTVVSAGNRSEADISVILADSTDNHRLTSTVKVSTVAKAEQKKLLLQSDHLKVEQYFQRAIIDIDNTLFSKQKSLKIDQQQLNNFIETSILPLWDVEHTLKLLIGSKRWKKLRPTEIDRLKVVFVDSLHRYVREGVKLYDGQRLKMNRIQFSKKTNRGLMTVQLEPIYLPAFNIDFKIAKHAPQWLSYDVLIQGVSYVKMKKNEYRQILDGKGAESLIAYLSKKNQLD